MSMKKLLTISTLLVLFSFLSAAQNPESIEKPIKLLSAADKAVIIEIFKTLDPKDYYLEFKNKEVYGLKKMQPSALFAIKTDQLHTASAIIKWYKEISLLFVIAQPSTVDLKTIFGKANAARLQAIITKYTGGTGNN